jgi:hypothetical protein
MSVSLSQILMLAGPLDDSTGFDAPRERFRRYLTENVAEISSLKALIEDAQRLVGEQPHRALQDALVVLGRFLGFETTFGTYQRLAGAVQYEGQWRSRHRLHVLLEIRGDQTQRIDHDDMTRALAALSANTALDDAPRLGLSVVTPLFAARGRLDEEHLLAKPGQDRRVVSTRSLLWLAEAVSGGQMTHDEVVRLLVSGQSLDLIVELLERHTDGKRPKADSAVAVESIAHAGPSEHLPVSDPDCWAVVVDRSGSSAFEQIVHSAVASRHVLGVLEDQSAPGVARPGDAVCFFLPGKGVVGRAEIATPEESGLQLIRDTDRFSRLYRVRNVVIFDVPVVPGLDAQQTLMAHLQRMGVSGPLLVPVSPQKFESLTTGPAPGGMGLQRLRDAKAFTA